MFDDYIISETEENGKCEIHKEKFFTIIKNMFKTMQMKIMIQKKQMALRAIL